MADAGDIACNPFDISEAIATSRRGADPSTGPAAMTWAATTPSRCPAPGDHPLHGPIAVLHFDAHLDTWDTYFGAPYTHGTPFRRASEEGCSTATAACI